MFVQEFINFFQLPHKISISEKEEGIAEKFWKNEKFFIATFHVAHF